ncbi:MAG: D-alanine--D-alanine ligase family protein [Caldilineaceae bacterium]
MAPTSTSPSQHDLGSGKRSLRVGVLFGGRSSEHEVSLNSARNVMDALRQAGHEVIPMGITQEGRWITTGEPHAALVQAAETRQLVHAGAGIAPLQPPLRNGNGNHSEPEPDTWALLPRSAPRGPLPAVDVIFPVLHGPFGEDGTVQGLLEMADLPYVGCGVLSSAVSMDKVIARKLFAGAGLPQVAYRQVMRADWRATPEPILEELESALGYPLFVKPANLGSSVGISKARDRASLRAALDLAARYDRKLLVEKAVPHAREIEVSVLGNDAPEASVPGEIVPGAEFYSYAAKYLDDNSDLLIPAPLAPAVAQQIRQMALDAFRAVEGSGLARVDFLLDGESGEIFLNEINTLPGFTRISMYPKLWEATGVGYAELVDRLVQLALERYADTRQNETTRE